MSMASSLLTVAKTFLLPSHKTSLPSSFPHHHHQHCTLPLGFTSTSFTLKANSFKINAISKKWEPSKVVPQADRVLLRLEQLPEKSAGGVLLPKSAVKFERYLMGEVVSVGTDVGDVQAGKKVLLSDINAYEVDLGTVDKHCFCKASDLLAVVE